MCFFLFEIEIQMLKFNWKLLSIPNIDFRFVLFIKVHAVNCIRKRATISSENDLFLFWRDQENIWGNKIVTIFPFNVLTIMFWFAYCSKDINLAYGRNIEISV